MGCIICGYPVGETRIEYEVRGRGALSNVSFEAVCCPTCYQTLRQMRAAEPSGTVNHSTVEQAIEAEQVSESPTPQD